MKTILISVFIFLTGSVSFAETQILDDQTICQSIKTGNSYKILKDSILLRSIPVRNNVGQSPLKLVFKSGCDVYSIYPVYERSGYPVVFQNIFKNGNWLMDLPAINNVGQRAYDINVDSGGNIYQLFPPYERPGYPTTFQNVFKNGKWLVDLPVQ